MRLHLVIPSHHFVTYQCCRIHIYKKIMEHKYDFWAYVNKYLYSLKSAN